MKELLFSSLLLLIPASFIERISKVSVRDVSGTVIGFDDSLPIEGVTVAVKGSGKATGTQADGSFYLRLDAPKDSVLLISHAGYQSQQLRITNKNDYSVILKRSGY